MCMYNIISFFIIIVRCFNTIQKEIVQIVGIIFS